MRLWADNEPNQFLFKQNNDLKGSYYMSETHIKIGNKELTEANWLEVVRRQVNSLQYGAVEIIVHDSRVTQIEKTERLRLDKPPSETRPNGK